MEANTRNLERIFDQTISYQIPLFQRPYVWEEERNWQPLWEDIQLLMDRYLERGRVHSHFLGAVVLEQVSNPTGSIEARQVIDGQQRLTTLQLFLIAARDLCRELGEGRYLERFTDLTGNKASRIDANEEVFKIWPTNSDREVFSRTHGAGSPQEVVLEFIGKKKQTRVGKNIPDAYLYFSQKLRDWSNGNLGDEISRPDITIDERLEALWQVVRAHLQLVVIDLDSEDESQVIFETLNARGTQLLPGDLIKNYLFHKAANEGEDVERLYKMCWHEFDDPEEKFWREEVKQGRIKRPRIDLFLQHYLALKTRDDVRVAHIFNTFKYFAENVPSESSPCMTPGQHLESLRKYGLVFRDFFQPRSGSRLDSFLQRLAAIDTATVYPFLLEACHQLKDENESELDRILVWLESFLVRRMICGLTTKNYNKLFLDLVKSVQDSGGFTADAVKNFLSKSEGESARFPRDEEFQKAWMQNESYRRLAQYKIRSILSALEQELESPMSERMGLPDGLQIEHVMPVAWEENWSLDIPESSGPEDRLEAKELRNSLLHSFGNLTLVTASLNPSLSNGSWIDKKPELIKFSKLNMNRYFHDRSIWNEKQILQRGEALLDLAMSIWPYPKH